MAEERSKVSAGLMMYYIEKGKIRVFLAHPGGPFWQNRDGWGIPKGEVDRASGENSENSDELIAVAIREFKEETGISVNFSKENLIDLGSVKRKDGKMVCVWAFQGNGKEKFIKSNEFEMEWPLKSGRIGKFPEIDKGKYFTVEDAREKIHKNQKDFLDRLEERLKDKVKEERQGKLF